METKISFLYKISMFVFWVTGIITFSTIVVGSILFIENFTGYKIIDLNNSCGSLTGLCRIDGAYWLMMEHSFILTIIVLCFVGSAIFLKKGK